MARSAYDTLTRVDWVVSIPDISAPVAATLNAGTALSTFISKDGVQLSLSPNNVDSSTIADKFDAQGVGTYGGGLTLKGYRDIAADTFWNLVVYGTVGFVVVRYGILYTTAYATSQKVMVLPVQMHEALPEASAANTQVMFTASFAITSTPNLKATVA
jgi:hypothetical protein